MFLFRNHDSHASRVNAFINDPLFWEVFDVCKSTPDGHCFIYSVISSLRSQGSTIHVDDLLQSIDFECFDNTCRYLPFMGEDSSLLLFQAMNAYTISRHYNSDFVDLIPQICANALGICINIIVKHLNSFIFYRIQPINRNGNQEVFVYKNGDHYDCLIPSMGVLKCSAVECDSFVSDPVSCCLDGGIRNHSSVSVSPTQTVYTPSRKSSSTSGKGDPVYINDLDIASLRSLGILFHNIHGLSLDKISDDSLGSFFKTFLLILLVETWLSKDDDLDKLDGYVFYNLCRSYRHPNAIRDAGGIGMYVHKSVSHGIELISNRDDIVATLKIKKDVFCLPFDIFVSNCYIVPENSTYLLDDVFSVLQDEIVKTPSDAESLMFLDANAHTSEALDFVLEIEGSDSGLDRLIPDEICEERLKIMELYNEGRLTRHSLDKRPLNSHGRDLLDLCKSCNKLIINSRLPGNDFRVGLNTHYNPDGSGGNIDYAICSPNLFNFISNFEVHGKFPESDHCPISVHIPINLKESCNSEPNNNPTMWEPAEKIIWSKTDLVDISESLNKNKSNIEYENYRSALSLNESTDKVAQLLNSYVIKSCKSVCKVRKTRKLRKRRYRRLNMFDSELRKKRRDAIIAGERVITEGDRKNLANKTRLYKSCLQNKKRNAKRKRRNNLLKVFESDISSIWAELNKEEAPSEGDNVLRENLFNHFVEIGNKPSKKYFDKKHLNEIESFLKEYDMRNEFSESNNESINLILNKDFSIDEINHAIDSLKNNKSPGIDGIPAEFVKFCKEQLSPELHLVFNYMLEKREFPKTWAEGLKSAIFKAGLRNNPSNYRGITVLGIFAKIFETLVNNRFEFVNEAFCKIDAKNGGFLKGKRTSDNLFILNGIIKRQLLLNKTLYVCFVDFSKAFDMVNRDILFFKLLNSGWSGRMVDTVRDLYQKTSFRFKFEGSVSPNVSNDMGVNQGGNASGFLFRKYLSDLSEYLFENYGVCIGDSILAHLLWADDLVLLSDSLEGIQKQLDGLFSFCSKNMMIVNELKTKIMVFGNGSKSDIFFNGDKLKWVDQYKYLGNIISSIKVANGDIFKNTYSYLVDKARKAIFLFFKKAKSFGVLPPSLMIKAYQTLIQPILLYGSDVWGFSKAGCEAIDKLCLFFLRCVLRVKKSTSKLMCYGDLGVLPPSVHAHSHCILFHSRISNLPENDIVRSVYNVLHDFNEVGFNNELSKVKDLASSYNLDMTSFPYNKHSIQSVKSIIKHFYRLNWHNTVMASSYTENSSLRMYKLFKNVHVMEPYLLHVDNDKHRHAMSKFRCSSHFLEIERARHQVNIPPIWNRCCPHCNYAVDDELHLLLFCKTNEFLRVNFLSSISDLIPDIAAMHHLDIFIKIMSSEDKHVLRKLAKYVYESLEIRKRT